jgi:pimeloyl-ACP methyl ester carboxylesterase
MDRRTFVSMVAAGAASTLSQGNAAAAQPASNARNVVLVHGLFADGSCWSEVIARLQAAGLNATAVQNPLTTLPEAVASAQRVLARQDGPTVLVGHSFSGMIVTEAGMHPNVSALVYVAARAQRQVFLCGRSRKRDNRAGAGPYHLAGVCRLNIIDANRIDPPIAIITKIRLPRNPRPAVPAIIQTDIKKAIMRTYQIMAQRNVYQA